MKIHRLHSMCNTQNFVFNKIPLLRQQKKLHIIHFQESRKEPTILTRASINTVEIRGHALMQRASQGCKFMQKPDLKRLTKKHAMPLRMSTPGQRAKLRLT